MLSIIMSLRKTLTAKLNVASIERVVVQSLLWSMNAESFMKTSSTAIVFINDTFGREMNMLMPFKEGSIAKKCKKKQKCH